MLMFTHKAQGFSQMIVQKDWEIQWISPTKLFQTSCYICSQNHESHHVFSLICGLVPGSSEVTGYFILLVLLQDCKPLHLLGYFLQLLHKGPCALHPMDDCEHPLLYSPGTGKVQQETAISGSYQLALVGTCLVSGFCGCLWGGYPSGAASGWLFLQALL